MHLMRKIPAAMATQHPDNASPHAFSGRAFVATSEEAEDAHFCFAGLGCGEFMWDWEGKHVDEAVIERLFEGHPAYYRRRALGRDLFLTYRVPNVWKEKGYRLARSFANVISANDLAEELGLHAPPVFELILPMTTSGRELFYLRSKYSEVKDAFEIIRPPGPADIQLIPLIEEPDHLFRAGSILSDYADLCSSGRFSKFAVEYVRPFIARSDPALNAGMVPAVLSAKAALSDFALFSEERGVPAFPIIGVGGPPFRGGLTPERTAEFCAQYPGVRTATVQSSFRADNPLAKVKAAIRGLGSGLSRKARVFAPEEKKSLKSAAGVFSDAYRRTVERIAPFVQKIARHVPARRERRLHIGLFGYSRSVGRQSLPRAISFTCSLYSIGVPPEFIGTGRGLKALKSADSGLLGDSLSHLGRDLEFAGRFLNKGNLAALASSHSAWAEVARDVALCGEELGLEFGPCTDPEFRHQRLASRILSMLGDGKPVTGEIGRAAVLRGFLG
ncbi:MAG: phosphoenolpyruvate carboxylase [Candidatus Micrarchaeota archaeon]